MNSWIFILFYTSSYNPIFNFVAQIVPTLSMGSSFSWLQSPFDMPREYIVWMKKGPHTKHDKLRGGLNSKPCKLRPKVTT